MKVHAKVKIVCKHRHLWTINLVSELLEFYTKICYAKVSLVKPTVKSGSKGFIQNLFCKFWAFLQVSMNFWSLNYFLGIKINGKKIKTARLAHWAESAPGPAATTMVAQPAHTGAARTPCGHHARDRRGGAATDVQPWDKVRGHQWG
jgi:hypothetical protein